MDKSIARCQFPLIPDTVIKVRYWNREQSVDKCIEAIALAVVLQVVIRSSLSHYPTRKKEIPEYLSKYLTEKGKVFVQAESEVAAINMVYGAAGAGARVMTSSSSVGIALKQEGISYLAGSELPCVIVSVMRAGPGLGGIQPSQADYFQATSWWRKW
jgi:2-oxoglutarate ferredoxin oxidoreductase subunit alpha